MAFVYHVHLPEDKGNFDKGYIGFTSATVEERWKAHLYAAKSGNRTKTIRKSPMPHKLFRLTQKLQGVPHLVEKNTFNNIMSYLEKRNMESASLGAGKKKKRMDGEDEECPEQDAEPEIIGGIAIIEVNGPLTYKPTGWEAFCGGCSYESILEQAEEAIEDGCKTIVLNIDSGGGEAYGCFQASEDLRIMCDEAGVFLVGYVDGLAASAAYALACVCDELYANKYSEVGSVGVLICLMDQSKHLEEEGYKPIFVTAGDSKIPYAEDGSFKPEFLADLQYKVDKLYEDFVAHVAKYTGLSEEAIKATEAKTFLAPDALALGLVDNLMTNSEFISYVVTQHNKA